MTRTARSLTPIITLLWAVPALAGGFQVQQQGAKASGRAGAFAAQADDASATFYNPASVGRFEGWSAYLGATARFQGDTTLDVAGNGTVDTQRVTDHPASLYVTGRLGEHYAVALGAFQPYSLRTRWLASDPVAGSAIDTEWTSREINVNVIGNIGRKWSFAVGFEWIKMHVEQFSSAYDFTRLASFVVPAEPLTAVRNITLEGDKAGANAAVHFHGDHGLLLGLSYRSKKVVQMEGDLVWSEVSDATFSPGFKPFDDSRCPPSPNLCPMEAAFTESPATSKLYLPASFQGGVAREGVGKWDWEVDLLWTKWDDFRDFDVAVPAINGIFQGLLQLPTTTDVTQEESWRDTLSIFGGFDYHINERHTVRGGLAYDQSPIKERFVRPYNPDADKIGLTGGYGWRSAAGRLIVDLFGQVWIYEDASEPDSRPLDRVVGGLYETTVFTLGASVQVNF